MGFSGNEGIGGGRRWSGGRCGGVRVVVEEMHRLACGELPRADRRRVLCHLQQVAMYVCHVALRMTMADVGAAYGRDRTTVAHACRVIEGRRDNRAYDEFISAVERVVEALSGAVSEDRHEFR